MACAVDVRGTDSSICRPITRRVSPRSCSSRVSPTQMIARRPARAAASALAWTSASVSPISVRRSEWPTITAVAPASRSISAEILPVKAPEAWGRNPAPDAQRRATAQVRRGPEQRERRADQRFGPPHPAGRHGVAQGLDFGQGPLQPVHFPIAGEKRGQDGHEVRLFQTSIETFPFAGYQTCRTKHSPAVIRAAASQAATRADTPR